MIKRTLLGKCPICEGQFDQLDITVEYGVPALGARIPIKFSACKACTFAFQENPLSDEPMMSYYKSSPRYRHRNVEATEASLCASQIAFMEHADPFQEGLSVLDIGADMGKLLDIMHARGFTTAYMESNEKAVDYLNGHGRHRRIDDLKFDDRFDIIILSQVYEHIVYPVEFLRRLKEHLNASGLIFIEVPCHTTWDKSEYGFSFEHVNYFSVFALCRAVHNAGCYISRMEISSDPRYFEGRVKIIRAIAKSLVLADSDLVTEIQRHCATGTSERISAVRKLAEASKRDGSGGLALYGAAELADMILEGAHKSDFVAIFDTDVQKHGSIFHGFSVKAPADIPSTSCGGILILSAATAAIRQTIKQSGFAGNIFAWCELEM